MAGRCAAIGQHRGRRCIAIEDGRGPTSRERQSGLARAYRAIDVLVERYGLDDAQVVVDDPVLGRQLLRAGWRRFDAPERARLTGPPCATRPDGIVPTAELELLVELCTTALRFADRSDAGEGSTREALELALRRIPGVRAVTFDPDEGLVQVLVDADAPTDVAGSVSRATRVVVPNASTVVEVARLAAAAELPGDEPGHEDRHLPPTHPQPLAQPELELLGVYALPREGEIEVHLSSGEQRTVGRAPARRGLAGAVDATLSAISQTRHPDRATLASARTIETTADGAFRVGVTLVDPQTGNERHGVSVGTDPIQAAVQASLAAFLGHPPS